MQNWGSRQSMSLKACLCLMLATVALRAAVVSTVEDKYSKAERNHWSLRPRSTPEIPNFGTAAHREWAKSPVDAFILARLHSQGLTPAPPADRATLARRVYLDVTGLPPTPEQVSAFVNDRAPRAWSRLIDKLLATPEYAERWAQHWLDVVRFAESDGFEYDTHRSNAWEYRDYVIRSFQEDKPYDQFIREQLAGDEIDPGSHEMLVAASFNRLGPFRKNAGNQDQAYIRNEVLTEMAN